MATKHTATKTKPTPPPAPAGPDRAAALRYLQKKTPTAFRDAGERLGLDGITTGSFVIDYIIGNGGFPRTKVSEIFGTPGSGKSTLSVTCCAEAQRRDLYPIYIDAERGLDRQYASRIGFDVEAAKRGEKGLYVTPDTFEDTLEIVETMVSKAHADIIIVDSVASLVPKEMFDGDLAELSRIGLQARMFANALPRLTKLIDRPDVKTALVFVNQIRAKMNTGWGSTGDPYKAAGGYALEHFSSMRLQLKQIQKVAKFVERPGLTDTTKDRIPVASLHEAMTFKNKVSQPYRKIKFYIRFDTDKNLWGIDNLQTLVDIAINQGVIEAKGGGHYLYNGAESMQVQGETAAYDWFFARPPVADELLKRLTL